MDLSKNSDCINRGLLIAKQKSYVLDHTSAGLFKG